MRKIFILSLLVHFVLISNSQEKLKKKTISNSASYTAEKFTVLKEDKSIKQGEYKKYDLHFINLYECGYYTNNLKDSIWIQYLNQKIMSIGKYDKGKQIGIWNYFYYSGGLHYSFDFETNALSEYNWNPDVSKALKVKVDNEWIESEVDSPPLSLDTDIIHNVAVNVVYPAYARENGIQGTVLLSVQIDKEGNVNEYKISKSVDPLLDEESVKVIKRIKRWYPAILNGKKVDCEYSIPITFKLN